MQNTPNIVHTEAGCWFGNTNAGGYIQGIAKQTRGAEPMVCGRLEKPAGGGMLQIQERRVPPNGEGQ